jgi:hypothetical protein
MSNFPFSLDDDTVIPLVSDNISEIGGDAINALRDAVFAIESNIGVGAAGATGSIANFLNVSFDPFGNIKPSVLTSAGLVSLPIVDSQVSPTAGIKESKLTLDYSTASLFNSIENNAININTALNFITVTGSKVEPHIAGTNYNHFLSAINIAASSIQYFRNRTGSFRDNTNLYNLFTDFNNDLVSHEKADSTNFGFADPTSPTVGTIPPPNYAHVASGLFLNTSNFSFIPQTATDLQQFAQFIDNSNIFILGTKIQTLFANGISRTARSGTLSNASEGQLIIPSTTVITYLLSGGSGMPVDSIDNGDDIIEFTPDATSIANSSFDAKFATIKIGDIITVNYGSFILPFVIKETKLSISGSNKRYLVRITKKNILAGTNFTATVSKPLFNNNKYGVLALAQANTPTNNLPTLIAGNPRGAQVLGVNFNPDQVDTQHYNLWLAFYPDGNPLDSIINMAPIDVSGNKGTTPGQYTLDTIVESTNNAFRAAGFNYRFIAYSYQGNFGIMLADPYGNASFSIISGILASTGLYDPNLSSTTYPNNIVGTPGFDSKDALGFGPAGANVATPPFSSTFANSTVAQTPTKIFVPLTRNNYYVNGVERERLNVEPHQILDGYGDGYWPAIITNKQIIPGTRVEVTYQVNADLSESSLKIGKTLVVLAGTGGSVVDSGRFFIDNIQFNNCSLPNPYTLITVYDAIHSTGSTPFASANIGTPVSLYFGGDAIGFNIENASDFAVVSTPFKRSFEIYINQDGYTFSHERGRMNISGSTITVNGISLFSATELSFINIYKISSKLRGYLFSPITKINLQITSYSSTTGIFSGFLCQYDGSTVTNAGPTTIGKKGNVVRFYDQTNVEYIDFVFNINDSVPSISTTKNIDIQLFPTLRLDEEEMLIGTVQVNNSNNKLSYLRDDRQFGNTSEEQFSTSALDYIAVPTKLLSENGIIRGFDIASISGNNIFVNGGVAVVNGKIIQLNNEVVSIPVIQETLVPYGSATTFNTTNWFLCVNDRGELEFIASTDFDPVALGSTYSSLNLDHTRIFYANNPNNSSGSPYPIRGDYFADLILMQRDVTPIAVISSTIGLVSSTFSVTSASSSDARRFIYGGYSGLINPLVLGNNANFRSFTSLSTWLTQLTSLNSGINGNANNISQMVIVKGSFTLPTSNSLSFGSPVTFIGDNGTLIINTDIGFTIGNNITFDNITFNYTFNAVLDAPSPYVSSNLVNSARAAIYCNVSSTGNKNIVIRNCTFNASFPDHFPFISFEFASATSFLENIQIINNKFNGVISATDDLRAAVCFVNKLTTTGGGTSIVGTRLTGCIINKNICNKNQMICITADHNTGDNHIKNAITPVDTIISENICGAIGILTRQDTTGNYVSGLSVKDKENNVIISNNFCKYIASLDSAGALVSNTALFEPITSSIVIQNNTCGWIHLLVAVDDLVVDQRNSVKILSNKLNALPTSVLSAYGTSNNSAINIYSGNSFIITNVICDGNIIQLGVTVASDLVTTTNSFYLNGIECSVSATISKNIISIADNMSGTISTYGILLDSTSDLPCIITNNRLMRSVNTITGYINVSNAVSHHTIVDNFFDNTTIDGTHETPVLGVGAAASSGTLFERNKNQIEYVYIPIYDNSFGVTPNNTDGYGQIFYNMNNALVDYELTSGFSDQPNGLGSSIINGSGVNCTFARSFQVGTYLPRSVQILEIKVGIFLLGGTVSPLNTSQTIQLQSLGYVNDEYMDIKNTYGNAPTYLNVQSYVVNNSSQLTNLQSATQFLVHTIAPSEAAFFTVGNTNQLAILFKVNLSFASASYNIQVSPIRVKFAW